MRCLPAGLLYSIGSKPYSAHEKGSTFLREINSRRAAKPFTATEIYDIAPVIRVTFTLHVVL